MFIANGVPKIMCRVYHWPALTAGYAANCVDVGANVNDPPTVEKVADDAVSGSAYPGAVLDFNVNALIDVG